MENLFLILIAIVLLGFIWLMWLRQSLLHRLRDMAQGEAILRRDLAKRRDMVPYLLEGYKQAQDQDQAWRDLLSARQEFHAEGPSIMEAEWQFEATLQSFLQQASLKNLTFLEAKKDIEEITALIHQEKDRFEAARTAFATQAKQFPYSLASAIFGFRNMPL